MPQVNFLALMSAQPLAKKLAHLILEIDHIAIAVTDLDAAIRWYSDTLGFTLLERRVTSGEHSSMCSVVMNAGQIRIVLLQGIGDSSQICKFINEFGPGVHHIAYAVKNLQEAMRLATECGCITDTEVTPDPELRQIFLRRDPATGVRIELIERNKEQFSDQNAEHLYRALEEKDLY